LACTERVDHIKDIVSNICHVVSGVGFVTEAVSAKVNGRYCMTKFGKTSRWPIPQTGVRGKTMNKKDGNAGGLVNRRPLQHAQGKAVTS
jgi:hypothetical protein